MRYTRCFRRRVDRQGVALSRFLSVARIRQPGKPFDIFSHLLGHAARMPPPLALLLAVALSSALALLLLFWIAARNDRDATLKQGWLEAERASELMEGYMALALEISRQVTGRVAGRIVRSHAVDYFRGENWAELGELAGAAPMIGSIWIYDGEGNLVANSVQRDPPKGNFSDREFYPVLKGGAAAHIMGLTHGRVKRVWFFSYNLAVRAGGELLGIAQASMYADDFGNFFTSLGLPQGARFRVYRRDGTVVTGGPAAGASAGADDSAAALFSEYLPHRSEGRLEDAGGGVQYLRAYRTLPGFDIVVIASVPRDAVLQPYWHRLARNGALLGSAYLLLAGFAAAAYRAARRGEQMERALRESEERFRGIYKHAATGIAMLDLQGRFESCNPAYSAMLGYTEEELRALNFQDLVHPQDRDANMAENRRLLAQEIPSFEIVNRYLAKSGLPIWVHKHVSLLRDAAGKPVSLIALVTDMTDRKRYEEHICLLMREVNHRSKNMLTLVQAVARQTIAANPEDFLDRFGKRVEALAASQDLLVKNAWRGVDLDELVRSQLAHFEDLIGSRIEFRGPALFVSASAAQAIGMALHELATNASKYGTLAHGDGRIGIEWGLEQANAGAAAFVMSWREQGAHPITAPSKRGFGLAVICEMAELSLNAKVELNFPSTGLIWRLRCPAAEVLEESSSASADVREAGA